MSDNAQEKKPGEVNITVDGIAMSVPEGTNILEAAKTVGTDISAFCYHPGLSIAACCRQCLVSVEGSGKLLPSCQTPVRDGMVVETKDDRSKTARRQMLEFTLLNHPIDCPICDKAGECTLQSLYFDNNNQPSRVDVVKVRKKKVVDLGPTVVLDQERCILCTRCIRVCDEVAGVHQLEMANRGDHEELTTAPGENLDNPYSLNVVDVCPVGALTAKDFRFKMRAWELMMTPSVCTGCSTGCNIEIHHRDNRVWRIVPRENADVNGHWMCDEGRFTYKELREERLAVPTAEGMPASWDKAMESTSSWLKEHGGPELAFVYSANATNEENYLLSKIASKFDGAKAFVVQNSHDPSRADDKLMDADINSNTKGATAITGASVIDAAGLADALEAAGVKYAFGLGLDTPELQAGNIEAIALVSQETQWVRSAKIALPIAMWAEAEGTITNRDGKVQRLHEAIDAPGQARAGWSVLSAIANAVGVSANFQSAQAVFDAMSKEAGEALDGATWGRPVQTIQLRFAHSRG